MLVPAILYKEQTEKEFEKRCYDDDMFYETGRVDDFWIPNITSADNNGRIHYAIVDNKNNLLGYIGYRVDWYCDCVSNFGMMSFVENGGGKAVFGRDVINLFDNLCKRFHRVEWRCIGGNPFEKQYDKLVFSHNGNKHVLKDATRDKDGNYRCDIIYEIMNKEK